MSDKTEKEVKKEENNSPFNNEYFNYDPNSTRYDYEDFQGKSEKDKDAQLTNNKFLNWLLNNNTREQLRLNAYNEINPSGYSGGGLGAYWRAYKGLTKPGNKQQSRINNKNTLYRETSIDRDDIWRTYLGIPSENAHYIQGEIFPTVIFSKYKPTKGSNNSNYYTLSNIPQRYIDDMIRPVIGRYTNGVPALIYKNKPIVLSNLAPLSIGQSELAHNEDGRHSMGGTAYFGTYTLGRGLDPQKGEYVSFYDKWDLTPIKKYGEDESKGLGHPIEFYDRIYLDDYFETNTKSSLQKEKDNDKETYYQGYLPEFIFIQKRLKGGKLIPRKRSLK